MDNLAFFQFGRNSLGVNESVTRCLSQYVIPVMRDCPGCVPPLIQKEPGKAFAMRLNYNCTHCEGVCADGA